MSRDRTPETVGEMIAWLRAHPDEPFLTSWSGGRLLVGTRSDEGDLHAWSCSVLASKWVMDKPARSQKGRRPARSGGRG